MTTPRDLRQEMGMGNYTDGQLIRVLGSKVFEVDPHLNDLNPQDAFAIGVERIFRVDTGSEAFGEEFTVDPVVAALTIEVRARIANRHFAETVTGVEVRG